MFVALTLAFSAIDFDIPPRIQRNPNSPPPVEDIEHTDATVESDDSVRVKRGVDKAMFFGGDSDGVRVRRSQRREKDVSSLDEH